MRRTEYGSEFDWLANEAFLTECDMGLPVGGASYYRSGRDAMKAFALACAGAADTVLLPALCCESMIVPFVLNGYKVEFYKMNADLSGDTEDVRKKLKNGAVLLYMRYFGIRPFESGFLAQLKEEYSPLFLVEDRTQDIIVPRADEAVSDAMLASLRKWAALPDGGVLRTELAVPLSARDSRFCDTRRAAMEKKSRYLSCFKPEMKKEFLAELNSASAMLDEDGAPVGAAEEYTALLRHIDFNAIYERRLRNIDIFKTRLEPLRRSGRLRFLTERAEDSCLYFPILLDERGEVQKKMAQRDIYCPVIWPAPEETKGVCEVSEYICSHMLALPCDQRYDAEDIHFIADTLEAALG